MTAPSFKVGDRVMTKQGEGPFRVTDVGRGFIVASRDLSPNGPKGLVWLVKEWVTHVVASPAEEKGGGR